MAARRGDTRERIQRVAMELFGQRGYGNTSLREIAERLEVTKAALYHHFSGKEAILESIVDELNESLDELLEWGRARPNDDETRRAVLRRLADVVGNPRMRDLMRLSQQTNGALGELEAGKRMSARIGAITELVNKPDADLVDQMRAQLAIGALLMSSMTLADAQATDRQRADAALTVALELVSRSEG